VLDELNVEQLELVTSLEDRIVVTVELDIRDIAALPPNAVPALRTALAARPATAVRAALLDGGTITLPVRDTAVTLGWADLAVVVRGRDGFAAAADRDVVVALDTTITPALRRKAVARQVVHEIQMLRKEARLNVEDRIRVAVDARGDVATAVDEHLGYIRAETFAVELRHGAAPGGWHAREVVVDETRIGLALTTAR
jgi:isoleucyl-tRNA synthetase